MLSHHLITHLEPLQALESSWNELCQQDPNATPFQSHAWLYTWCLANHEKPWIVLIYHAEKLVGILPFAYQYKFFLHRLHLLGAPDADYLGFILHPAWETAILDYFFQNLLPQQYPHIKLLTLSDLNERTPLPTYLLNHALDPFRLLQHTNAPCPYLELPPSWEEYLAQLSSAFRQSIRRKERQLNKFFTVHMDHLTNINHTQSHLETFMNLHQASWVVRNRPGAFARLRFAHFHRLLAPRLWQEGALYLVQLQLNGQPVAAYYFLKQNKTLYYYLSGFDPQQAQYSPASVLLAMVIRSAITQGITEVDLMRGTRRYKYHWTSKTRRNHSLTLGQQKSLAPLFFYLESHVKQTTLRCKEYIPTSWRHRIWKRLPTWFKNRVEGLFRN
ncbi:MAG: GNAT family N-acetyltransferase [Magnetococcus sp. DMHC-6]